MTFAAACAWSLLRSLVVAAAGLEKFVLYGSSQGAPIAITYAARHPDRVSHLILHGGYVQGRLIRGA